MFERKGFIQVTYKEFKDFIKDISVNRCRGESFHSEYYLDKDGNKIAYMETSSWGAPDIYEIKIDKLEVLDSNNLQVINLVGKLIK